MPDMIDHEKNRYLAEPFDVADFSYGIEWVLENKERHKALSATAREKAYKNFEIEANARAFKAYDASLLEERSPEVKALC